MKKPEKKKSGLQREALIFFRYVYVIKTQPSFHDGEVDGGSVEFVNKWCQHFYAHLSSAIDTVFDKLTENLSDISEQTK